MSFAIILILALASLAAMLRMRAAALPLFLVALILATVLFIGDITTPLTISL